MDVKNLKRFSIAVELKSISKNSNPYGTNLLRPVEVKKPWGPDTPSGARGPHTGADGSGSYFDILHIRAIQKAHLLVSRGDIMRWVFEAELSFTAMENSWAGITGDTLDRVGGGRKLVSGFGNRVSSRQDLAFYFLRFQRSAEYWSNRKPLAHRQHSP